MRAMFSLLCLSVILLSFSLSAQFAGGSGAEVDPWLIRTAENLDSLRYYLGSEHADKHYKQIADIDLGVSPWNVGAGWEPIGTVTDSMFFCGHYKGDGFKILNLTINRPDQNILGLFGAAHNIFISDLYLEGVNITGHGYIGGLIGFNWNENGLVTRCYVKGNISGTNSLGGLIGGFHYMGIDSGYSDNRTTDCFTSCNIRGEGTSNSEIGGMFGANGLFSFTKNCYSVGSVSAAAGSYAGGFDGSCIYEFSEHNYWDVETSGCLTSYCAEGRTTEEMKQYSENTYVDWNFDSTWVKDISMIYGINSGYPVLRKQLPRAVPAAPDSVFIEKDGISIKITWINPFEQNDGSLLTELTDIKIMKDGNFIFTETDPVIGSALSFEDISAPEGWNTYYIFGSNSSGAGILKEIGLYLGNIYAGGTGTPEDPYLIETAEHLSNIRFSDQKQRETAYFKQVAHIDLGTAPWSEAEGWEPINEFGGHYDGNNFSIYNIYINRPLNNYIGLFGKCLYSAEFNNIFINGYTITGNDYVGTISGYYGSYDDVNVTSAGYGSVSGNEYVGGLSGYTGLISNSYFNGTIEGERNIGGLCGACYGSIFRCSSLVNITGGSNLGGLVGTTVIFNSLSIDQSWTMGNVSGTYNIGGMIGSFEGDSGQITDSYSMVDVSGTSMVAGFAPFADVFYGNGITNCYSTGKVTGTSSTGGFMAREPYCPVTNCYWDTDTSGILTSSSGEGRTTEEMWSYGDSVYVGWDFDNIWEIHYTSYQAEYPIHQWGSGVGIQQDHEDNLPSELILYQNYPNPFNPVTQIKFALAKTANVKLSVYNIAGQKVTELINRVEKAGHHTAAFDGSKFNSGIYYYTLESGGKAVTKKMLMVK
jgi:hypothetical protein